MSELSELWARLRNRLQEAVSGNDFSFLTAANLPKYLKEPFEEVLRYASICTEFPQIYGLSEHMRKHAIKPYILTTLKNRGFLVKDPAKRWSWEITLFGLQGLETIPPELLQSPRPPVKRGSRNPGKPERPKLDIDGKIYNLYAYLQEEKVSDELVLDLEQRIALAERFKTSASYLRQMLKVLQKKGYLTQSSPGKKRGVLVLNFKKVGTKPPVTPAIASKDPVARLQGEIDTLKLDMDRHKQKIDAMQEAVNQKLLVLAELQRLLS